MISRDRQRMIGRRILQAVPVLLLVTFFSFLLLHLSPVDPAVLLAGENPTPVQIEEIRPTIISMTPCGAVRPLVGLCCRAISRVVHFARVCHHHVAAKFPATR